jgi:AcrR family transcriptional regulator
MKKTTLQRRPVVIWEHLERRAATTPAANIVHRMVTVAVHLADHRGWEALSMRRIASELGSGVMSLYYYVPSKADLLDLALDAALGEIQLPPSPSGNWREDLHWLAMEIRGCLKRHVWVPGLMGSRPAAGPNRLRQFEFALAAVSSLGPDIKLMCRMVGSLYIYVFGFVALELSEGKALRQAGFNKVAAPYVERLIASGEFPNVERFLREGRSSPPDDEAFAQGLDLVLEGMAALPKLLAKRKKKAAR